jgi:predicted nucleic acid-binding protein
VVLPEKYSEQAAEVLAASQRGECSFTAPDTFYAEFAHALRKAVLGERCSQDQAIVAVRKVLAVSIAVEPSIALVGEALPLALETSATLYDALYVVIAIRRDMQVLTADRPMCNAFASLKRCTHLADFVL